MGLIVIEMISVIVVWICMIPIIIGAIKAMKFRKDMTKQLWESIYKTSITCSSIILAFGFIVLISSKMILETNSIFVLLGSALLELILKAWPIPIAIYFIKKQFKKYSD